MQVLVRRFEERCYDDTAQSVIVPTVQGVITVLPYHITYLSGLVPGDIIIEDTKKKHHIIKVTKRGYVNCHDNICRILLFDI